MRSASALRFSNGCSSLNLLRILANEKKNGVYCGGKFVGKTVGFLLNTTKKGKEVEREKELRCNVAVRQQRGECRKEGRPHGGWVTKQRELIVPS